MKIRLSIAAGMLAATAACGGSNGQVQYQPAAWGENGHCYYVQDPREVDALWNDNRCPRYWTPYLMPIVWHEQYYPYYSSPRYIRYVPVNRRQAYTTSSTAFGRQYSTQIRQAATTAKWTDPKGKPVSTTKVKVSCVAFTGVLTVEPAVYRAPAPRPAAPAPRPAVKPAPVKPAPPKVKTC